LFSGVEFNVSIERGLRGVCDFLLSLSPTQLTIEAPVVAIVEAKNDNLKTGLVQCIAEMVAAQLFNREQGNDIPTVYGALTTGTYWKFLRLIETMVYVDVTEYHVQDAERIVGTYYLRPNTFEGETHIANCAYIVAADARLRGVARAMYAHSLEQARERGFSAMQFNFVVSTNQEAVRLWQSCGFAIVRTLPGAFVHPTRGPVDAYVMFRKL